MYFTSVAIWHSVFQYVSESQAIPSCFEGLDALTYLLIDTSAGTVIATATYTFLENGTCSIAPHMFDKDALVFDNGQIQKAGIPLPDGTPYLTLTMRASRISVSGRPVLLLYACGAVDGTL